PLSSIAYYNHFLQTLDILLKNDINSLGAVKRYLTAYITYKGELQNTCWARYFNNKNTITICYRTNCCTFQHHCHSGQGHSVAIFYYTRYLFQYHSRLSGQA